MAGSSARARPIVPCFVRSSLQPSTTPGTLTESTPRYGISSSFRRRNSSGVAARAERPLALSPRTCFVFASYTIAKRSPPGPFIVGSTTERTAAAVTAASIALPPCCSTRRPAADASGWLVAITPLRAMTTDLVERGLAAGRSPGSCGAGVIAVIVISARPARIAARMAYFRAASRFMSMRPAASWSTFTPSMLRPSMLRRNRFPTNAFTEPSLPSVFHFSQPGWPAIVVDFS